MKRIVELNSPYRGNYINHLELVSVMQSILCKLYYAYFHNVTNTTHMNLNMLKEQQGA